MDGLIEVPEPREADGRSSGEDRSAQNTIDDATLALDSWADQLRQHHLRNALDALDERNDLDDEDRAAIAACSRAIVDDVLQCPRWQLRSAEADVARAAVALFDLDGD